MYSYRFKPSLNFGNVNIMMTILIGVILFVFGKNILNFINGFFNPLKKEQIVSETGKELQEKIEDTPLPLVDEVKMLQKLNSLKSELSGLFGVSGEKCLDILTSCSGPELDWIYVKFGVRPYQHGFLSRKEELDLFGWFDRGFKRKEQNAMVAVWFRSKFRYVPVYGERNRL